MKCRIIFIKKLIIIIASNTDRAVRLVELRKLASTCKFGAFLDEILWKHPEEALAKKDLKLSDAVDTAIAVEIAKSDVANMKALTPVVNKLSATA